MLYIKISSATLQCTLTFVLMRSSWSARLAPSIAEQKHARLEVLDPVVQHTI